MQIDITISSSSASLDRTVKITNGNPGDSPIAIDTFYFEVIQGSESEGCKFSLGREMVKTLSEALQKML